MKITPLVNGFPGTTDSHGGFGWSSVALLEGNGELILAETGPPAYIPLLVTELRRRGIALEDISGILITHAHWDHLANITMFPNAKIWIGEGELEWARDLPAGTPFISDLHVDFLLANSDRVHRVNGGDEILPGIEVIATPGHTPGHVAYVVEAERTHILAGDAVKNLHELNTGIVASTLDREASERSVRTLFQLAEERHALVIPGHDVPLEIDSAGAATRTSLQSADITFFASPTGPPLDRSIRDST